MAEEYNIGMNEQQMGTERVWRLCLKMGIPTVLAQVVNLLYNIVDRIYIGNMPGQAGTAALGGLGLCSPVITLIAAFSAFVSGGGAPLAAKALGEGNEERARRILNNGFILLAFFSVTLGLAAFAFAEPLLYFIGAGESNFGYAYDYLTVYLIGTLFVQLATGLNTFLTAQGKSVTAMLSVLVGAVLNIALDPLFIFMFGMGVKGAAVATVISQFASACFVVFALVGRRLTLRLDLSLMRPDLAIIGAIAALGVASFVMSATESVIGFVLNGRLKYYGDMTELGGDTYVTVLTILQSSMTLITTPIAGFTQGVTPIISFNYGARHRARLKQCYFFTLGVCFGWCCLLGILMMSVPRVFGAMFNSDPVILDLTAKYMPLFVFGMLVFGIQRACQTTFVAVTQAGISLFIAIMRKILLLVPLAFIFPVFMGVGGVYLAEGVADTTAALICGTIFFFRFRAILRKTDDPDEGEPVELITHKRA